RPGSGFHGQRIEGSLPADDVIAPLDDFTPWRMIAWGFVSGRSAPVSFATVEVRPAASGETLALVRLTGNLPADSDGDGVPDADDDCPMTPDPAQDGNCGARFDAGGNDRPDGAPTGINLVMNPGCETGTTGWTGWHSTLTQAPLPHTGMYSCQVCLNPSFTDYTIDDSPNTVSMPRAGELYGATAWVKAGPTMSTQMVQLTLREHVAQGVIGPLTDGPAVILTNQWQQVQSSHTMSADAFDLDIYIGTTGAIGVPGDCFLVDDI